MAEILELGVAHSVLLNWRTRVSRNCSTGSVSQVR